MPYSLVLNLQPQSPIYPSFLTGRHLHALFLTIVSSVDQSLGDYLHQSQADKAFTLSTLQRSRRRDSFKDLDWQHPQSILPGSPCWWKISLLDDQLFGQLSSLWLNINPSQPWHLGSADLQITSILGTPQSNQPWANACSYEQIYEEASDSDRCFRFALCTPTAFRQHEYDSALPTRELIFNSLLSRWHKYSGITLEDFPMESIFPSYFNIRTEMVADSRSKFIGCVGEIEYRLFGEVKPLQIKAANALAAFCLYSGIGRKTSMGMGIALRLVKEKTSVSVPVIKASSKQKLL